MRESRRNRIVSSEISEQRLGNRSDEEEEDTALVDIESMKGKVLLGASRLWMVVEYVWFVWLLGDRVI